MFIPETPMAGDWTDVLNGSAPTEQHIYVITRVPLMTLRGKQTVADICR
jgi:hypothetical protein